MLTKTRNKKQVKLIDDVITMPLPKNIIYKLTINKIWYVCKENRLELLRWLRWLGLSLAPDRYPWASKQSLLYQSGKLKKEKPFDTWKAWMTIGTLPSSCCFWCHSPLNWRNFLIIQLVMGKESSRTFPNGDGSVKWPAEM